MKLPKEECENAAFVLEKTIKALKKKDAPALKSLSDKTIHSSCTYQDSGTTTSAVLIYALSKIIEREDYKKMIDWDKFEKKAIDLFNLAIDALKKNKHEAYEKYILQTRKLLEQTAGSLKDYIKEVLRKSSINKASKLYEHGISSEQTAHLLGLSQWEIAEYLGTKTEIKQKEKITIEKRAKIALQFFS
ncbi:hypothetical protein CMI45_02150 [Candidatus Pacearchaeota archaeon]|nr:hypothetical protein [Candidatus Pacearchaeota archaeon]|tara:strand:- start:227 stop:793 length:567 start_codon:yes stop_codon:yes gene_type:complete